MKALVTLTEGHCDLCDEFGPMLDGLCRRCASTDYNGPLSPWMVRVLFGIDAATAPNAWREYLDAMALVRGGECGATGMTLIGPMWARRVLEDVGPC